MAPLTGRAILGNNWQAVGEARRLRQQNLMRNLLQCAVRGNVSVTQRGLRLAENRRKANVIHGLSLNLKAGKVGVQ